MADITIDLNGNDYELAADASVADLLAALGMAGQQGVGVEVNGAFVEADKHATTTLQAADTVEVIHFLGGG